MRRNRTGYIKTERPEASTSKNYQKEERDLAYYVHDRVELMRQVFSIIKPKEVKAMVPECVRHLTLDDLEETCLEELLGISSKRLCAILDGAEPPSETDTSESEKEADNGLETISLDSLSSDDLSRKSERSKKHKRKKSKKHKKRHSASPKENQETEKRTALPAAGTGTGIAVGSEAALTALELLELHARARAIRAQIHAAKLINPHEPGLEDASSSSEVELKEEPPEVVEISSEDEKPSRQHLDKALREAARATSKEDKIEENAANKEDPASQSTKKKKKKDKRHKQTEKQANTAMESTELAQSDKKQPNNEDHAEVQQQIDKPTESQTTKEAPTRRIKLNRNNFLISVPNVPEKEKTVATTPIMDICSTTSKTHRTIDPRKLTTIIVTAKNKGLMEKTKTKGKKKSKDDKTRKYSNNDDHDEITLVLSDSEKMDLLGDLDRENLEKVSCSSVDSEESSAETSNDSDSSTNPTVDAKENTSGEVTMKSEDTNISDTKDLNEDTQSKTQDSVIEVESESTTEKVDESNAESNETLDASELNEKSNSGLPDCDKLDHINENTKNTFEVTSIEDIPIVNDEVDDIVKISDSNKVETINETMETVDQPDTETKNAIENDKNDLDKVELIKSNVNDIPVVTIDKPPSEEGELSERSSSEVEAFDMKPEVVCISDDDSGQKDKKKKKKNKKEKKAKKQKSKEVPIDPNPPTDPQTKDTCNKEETSEVQMSQKFNESEDDIYEILELSDDSSCYEVEGVSVLSKEPTSEEIEALSAKMDAIERVEVVTDEEIIEHELKEAQKEIDAANISWKDRYLDSKKVKRVLTTSNILNAIRKKNKELKRKLLESKKVETEAKSDQIEENPAATDIVEGSIEHFNTLEGSCKYVDPVKDPNAEKVAEDKEEGQNNVSKDMERDAKQLLKMYKKLLKLSDMSKPKDPNKKKKSKKQKKKKDNAGDVANT